MKAYYGIALLAAAWGAFAQVSYTTIDVYEDCTDTKVGTDTVTSTIVQTTCPLCSHTNGPSSNQGGGVHTTVYTTVYQTLCSTGLGPATYTITETCTGPTPSWTQNPTVIPPGYTTTVTVCTVCGTSGPTTVTLTVPCTTTPTTWVQPTTWTQPPSSSQKATLTGPTTTTTTMCPGSTICQSTKTTTSSMTRSTPPPYTAGALPTTVGRAGLIGGAIAAVGAALL